MHLAWKNVSQQIYSKTIKIWNTSSFCRVVIGGVKVMVLCDSMFVVDIYNNIKKSK